MNSNFLILFFTLCAILIGCVVHGHELRDTTSIKLHFFDGSSRWWIAVDPRDEIYPTARVDVKDSGGDWVTMDYDAGWGYFHLSSPSGRGYALPLTFRFTADNGAEVTAKVSRIASNALVDTKVQYDVTGDNGDDDNTVTPTATQAPNQQAPVATQPPSNNNPTPTQAPASSGSQQQPTSAPQAGATVRPSTPTQAPKPTQAAQVPTQAPKPTQAPPTPTQAPKPTQAPPAPTQAAKPAQPVSGDNCAIVPVSKEPIKFLVPLYVYPGAAWDTLITAAKNGAKIIAIINPNSGPNANGPDASYKTYMKKFQDADIDMVGYVHTSWGARSIDTVNSEIGIYASKYPGVKGIFFDEGATEASKISYYKNAYNTVLSKGFVHSILNPGTQPDQGYLDISSNIVIFENYASSLSSASFSSWVKCAPNAAAKSGWQYKFSAIIHTAKQADVSSLMNKAHNLGMGLVYVTDGAGGCCTYNTLASYFSVMASALKTLNTQ